MTILGIDVGTLVPLSSALVGGLGVWLTFRVQNDQNATTKTQAFMERYEKLIERQDKRIGGLEGRVQCLEAESHRKDEIIKDKDRAIMNEEIRSHRLYLALRDVQAVLIDISEWLDGHRRDPAPDLGLERLEKVLDSVRPKPKE